MPDIYPKIQRSKWNSTDKNGIYREYEFVSIITQDEVNLQYVVSPPDITGSITWPRGSEESDRLVDELHAIDRNILIASLLGAKYGNDTN